MKIKSNPDTEIYELQCHICGKIIKSLSEEQADHNMKVHYMTHDIDEIAREDKDG